MLNLGMSEILLFAIITLVVLGPDKLPEGTRFAGRWYGKIKRMVSNVQTDIDRELRMSELREQMQQELERIKQLEEKMQSQMVQLEQQDLLAESQPFKAKRQEQHTSTPLQTVFKYCEDKQFQTPFMPVGQLKSAPTILNLKKAV